MTPMRAPRRPVRSALVAMALLLSACGEEQTWNLRDISGVMPDLQFALTRAADGRAVTQTDYEGKVTVLFFGFTSCPDVCPLTMSKFAAALDGMERADDVRFLFVSVDPRRDTREVLRDYVGAFGEQFVGLRGDIPVLRELTKRYRVTFSYGDGYGQDDESGGHEHGGEAGDHDHGDYDVSHSSAAFVFDRDGDVRLLARQDASIDAIQADLEQLVES